MLTPIDLLADHRGVARGRLLQEYGCSRSQLAEAVRKEQILRLRPGVFALASADPKLVAASMHGGSLSCTDALRMHGIWTLPADDDVVHVWMGGSGRRHPHPDCHCITHHSPGTAGIGLAPLASALVHVFRCRGAEVFFAGYESALNRRALSAADRRQIRRQLPQSAGWLLDLARSDVESGLESLVRLRLRLLGIEAECQVVIRGVGRVDLVVGGRVIIEADGRLNHAGAERRHRDLTRDAVASALGYETLRFDYAMIVHVWDAVVVAVVAALARAVV